MRARLEIFKVPPDKVPAVAELRRNRDDLFLSLSLSLSLFFPPFLFGSSPAPRQTHTSGTFATS